MESKLSYRTVRSVKCLQIYTFPHNCRVSNMYTNTCKRYSQVIMVTLPGICETMFGVGHCLVDVWGQHLDFCVCPRPHSLILVDAPGPIS